MVRRLAARLYRLSLLETVFKYYLHVDNGGN